MSHFYAATHAPQRNPPSFYQASPFHRSFYPSPLRYPIPNYPNYQAYTLANGTTYFYRQSYPTQPQAYPTQPYPTQPYPTYLSNHPEPQAEYPTYSEVGSDDDLEVVFPRSVEEFDQMDKRMELDAQQHDQSKLWSGKITRAEHAEIWNRMSIRTLYSFQRTRQHEEVGQRYY